MNPANETLTLHQTAVAVAACARAGYVPLVLGPPGIGKTSLARAISNLVGKALGYPEGTYQMAECILSNREAVDVGGYPVIKSDDTVALKLFGSLSDAAAHPRCLLLDEFLTCPQSVQGPALRLTLERVAGEVPLHPDTRIIALANPPDQAPGGIPMTAALVNRLVVLYCRPSVQEIAAFFCGRPEANLAIDVDLADKATFTENKARFMDTAGILFEQRTDLLCFEPPPAAISDGEPFASPRAWEICCSVLASLPHNHILMVSNVVRALVLGSIGPGAGITFLTLLKARVHLPTLSEVLETPHKAKLPDEKAQVEIDGKTQAIGRDINFAAIPLVIEAARIDTYAAWVYVGRLPVEIQAAVAKSMTAKIVSPPNGSKFHADGQKVLLATVQRLTAHGQSAVKKAS